MGILGEGSQPDLRMFLYHCDIGTFLGSDPLLEFFRSKVVISFKLLCSVNNSPMEENLAVIVMLLSS